MEHQSHTKKIWKVFGILTVLTIVEVILGIVKPESIYLNSIFGLSILNWIFIILTLVKAYYIVWFFMHLDDEKKSYRASIIYPALILIPYLTAILLVEGDFLNSLLNHPYMLWS